MAGLKNHQPMPRYYHTSAQVASRVLVYSGRTEDRSDQTRKRLASIVELFDTHCEQWEAKQCSGELPPAGLCDAASASCNGSLFTYGGEDGDGKLLNSPAPAQRQGFPMA